MMPRQLRNSYNPGKGKSEKPIVEKLPSISTKELGVPSPYDHKTYILGNIVFRLPQLASARLNYQLIEFQHPPLYRGQQGPTQTFQFKHIRTGFGIRHVFICCHCGRPVQRLYLFLRNLACRHCLGGRYASQTVNQHDRPTLQASRIQSFLDSKPRLSRRTRDRLEKRLGQKLMMAQGRLRTRACGLWDGDRQGAAFTACARSTFASPSHDRSNEPAAARSAADVVRAAGADVRAGDALKPRLR
jgi:hypothetical protein